ncbi:hypothetical protein TNIN_27431 [Trichonephila inaurata madagascariensis]|uniref:MADF domain-containing protein n=1 Tax=Trichonephila inaurata madagascariensis TaxID=2747483 RepID=A0A8X7BW77_9ARAC|nr:hypothetical protein TNIN_27431 [Trichonephila inaurata madagascariensis]
MFLMKWDEIMESFLIDEVEKLPYLWNPKHPHFAKRLKKTHWIPADCHQDEREVAGTRSFPDARNYPCVDLCISCLLLEYLLDRPVILVMRIFSKKVCIVKFQNLCTYYRNEKKKPSSFRSGTGARDFVPKWEHFAPLQFLDDTIKPLDSTSNLDYMVLEINATALNVRAEDLFENVEEPPAIPCSESQSEQPQGCPTQPKKRKVDSSHEDFYESMQKCLGAVGKKTPSELDNLPRPKQQAAIRRKLCYTLFNCLE